MTTLPQPESGRPYGIQELISLLAKKWGEDYLAADEAAIAATIRARLRHSNITPEDIAKVNSNERIDMSKYEKKQPGHLPTWEESLLKNEHLYGKKVVHNKQKPDADFFPLTPDFSERDFEKFARGAKFTVCFINKAGTRELAKLTIESLEGVSGDTVVRYGKKFAILKGTHSHWLHKNELP